MITPTRDSGGTTALSSSICLGSRKRCKYVVPVALPPRSSKALDESDLDGPANAFKDDGDRIRCTLGRKGARVCARREDDIDFEAY